MATSEILRLFQTPEQYTAAQDAALQQQFTQRATLSPFQKASVLGQQAGYSAAQGIGGALGGTDPQLEIISRRNVLLGQLDPSDPESYTKVAQAAAKMGDSQFALAIAQEGRKAKKEMEPPKLTGDERYIKILQTVESKYLNKQEPTAIELSTANMAMQMLSKPRSYFDAASGQMVTQAATDPSKAFPLTFKAMGASSEEGATTTPKPTVQQATGGNLPSGSQTEIANIDASLKKLELSAPELQGFLKSLKSNEVKYNAKDNTFDFLGAIIPPAFGFKERGGQVKKDEIKRALTERVNTLLLMAKGTQTEGDATRAKDQIASDTTYLSQARMIGAIEGLERAEKKLAAELDVKRTALQSQGKTETPGVPTASSTDKAVAPAKQTTPSVSKQSSNPNELTREQKIQRFIDFNGGKPTRQEAEEALRKAGKL
jgi:hypothetical protein